MNADGETVVYVNPVVMGKQKWKEYMDDVKLRVQRGDTITNLVCSFCLLFLSALLNFDANCILASPASSPFATSRTTVICLALPTSSRRSEHLDTWSSPS